MFFLDDIIKECRLIKPRKPFNTATGIFPVIKVIRGSVFHNSIAFDHVIRCHGVDLPEFTTLLIRNPDRFLNTKLYFMSPQDYYDPTKRTCSTHISREAMNEINIDTKLCEAILESIECATTCEWV